MAKSSTTSPDRILVADPDASERARLVEVVRAAARTSGREVRIEEAANGTTAMALWSEHTPCLVVCEVLLEGISGLALLRRMKAERSHVPPVIFVTRLSRDSDRYWGLRNGAHAYLAKPYDDEQLRGRICDVLDHGADAMRQQPFE